MAELNPTATTNMKTVSTFCSGPIQQSAANAAPGKNTPTNIKIDYLSNNGKKKRVVKYLKNGKR